MMNGYIYVITMRGNTCAMNPRYYAYDIWPWGGVATTEDYR